MQDHEDGVSEIVAVLLLVALGMILSALVFAGILSFAGSMERTAYVAVDAEESPPGKGVRITSMAGDTLVIGGGADEIPLEIMVDDTFGAQPTITSKRLVFSPGSSICVWWDGENYYAEDTFPSDGTSKDLRLPLSIRLIDGRHHTLIARVGDGSSTSPSTGTPGTTVTAQTTTTTVTTEPLTTSSGLTVDFDVPYVIMKQEATFEGRVITGEPNSWTWTFTDTGGKSETRSDQTVHYTFNNSGSGWTVSLTVTDASGMSYTVPPKTVEVHNK